MRRRRLVPILALVLGLGLAACDSGSPAAPVSDPASVRGLDTGSSGIRAPSAQTGGTLTLVTGAVDSLDPQRSYSPGVWNVMRLYTRQLVAYAPKPGSDGARVVPDLATAPGRTTDGGRTWTYTLRPGLTWEDGRPLTSADVKYGIERQFASEVITGGPTWALQLLDDRTKPYDGPYTDKGGLKTIATPDARTITFTLDRPFADWDEVLALPAASPVEARADTGATYGTKPLSSGPYRIASATKAGTITFARNPHWSKASDPVRTALPDTIVLRTNVVPAERDREVLSGAADADVSGSGLQPEAAAEALNDPALAARVDDPSTGTLRFVAMPSAVGALGDVHCRRAVQYALDKAAVKDALGGPYAASLATTLWPRALPGYPATAPYPTGEGNRGDLVAARKELADCGQPNGFSTTLGTVNDGRGKVAADVVVRSLARVGIAATPKQYPRGTFLASVAGAPATVRADGLGLIVAEWAADFPSPYAFLDPLVDGRSVKTSANPNVAELSGDEEAIDEATATLDPVQATAAWRQVAATAMNTAGYAPLVEDRAVLLGSARLRNAYVQPAYRGYDLASLGVE
ncbi:MAG TPA: ABC transporter substrate-binding protein [Mycobacteriales bacterium]|nr:ABC transporter substrate-binding protein [Mycobacteriales bacterium]